MTDEIDQYNKRTKCRVNEINKIRIGTDSNIVIHNTENKMFCDKGRIKTLKT